MSEFRSGCEAVRIGGVLPVQEDTVGLRGLRRGVVPVFHVDGVRAIAEDIIEVKRW